VLPPAQPARSSNAKLVNFAQTHFPILPYRRLGVRSGEIGLFTSAECRALAEQKLAEAERDDRHRRRLITAAEAVA
jgi:hypothetical protein